MKPNKFDVRTEAQRATLMDMLKVMQLPFSVRWGGLKIDRSMEQNRISHAWFAQISRELREDTPADVKGFCKLRFGIPILREDPEFCDLYDSTIKPLDYPTKLKIMSAPDWFPVSSLMNVEQMTLYLDHIQAHYAQRGVLLQ